MQVTDKLRSQVAKAVKVSMQIEGYPAMRSNQTNEEAKRIMERQRVQVSLPDKPLCQLLLAGLNREDGA